jgi:hypothetical protein
MLDNEPTGTDSAPPSPAPAHKIRRHATQGTAQAHVGRDHDPPPRRDPPSRPPAPASDTPASDTPAPDAAGQAPR